MKGRRRDYEWKKGRKKEEGLWVNKKMGKFLFSKRIKSLKIHIRGIPVMERKCSE